MTTITYRNRKIASDGQVSFGSRIDTTTLKKVRKINGCLVGGAGRLASVLQFFDWFQEWSDAQQVQGDAPHVKVFVPEGIDDEDFNGLVVFADEVVFMYEGGKKSYQLTGENYYAIGSGSDFALAAMDAGAEADEAVAVAISRDVYSGGQIFVEELDPEPTELTREVAEGMEKGELISLLFGADETAEEAEDNILIRQGRVVVNKDDDVVFLNPETGDILAEINLNDSDAGSKSFNKLCRTLNRDYFDKVVTELGVELVEGTNNKFSILDQVLSHLNDMIIEIQRGKDAE